MATPHKNDWVKTSPYGDYRNSSDNHKDENRNPYYDFLVKNSKNRYDKHPGSKRFSTLRSRLIKE